MDLRYLPRTSDPGLHVEPSQSLEVFSAMHLGAEVCNITSRAEMNCDALGKKSSKCVQTGEPNRRETLTFSPIGVLENGTVFLGREQVEKAVRALAHVPAHRW